MSHHLVKYEKWTNYYKENKFSFKIKSLATIEINFIGFNTVTQFS